MEISAAQIKALRDRTGAGMMDCKTALHSAGGDMDGAIRHLREKGLATAAKRSGKVAAEGAVVAKIVSPSEGLMLELNCETDFVAKTPGFGKLAESILSALAGQSKIDGLVTGEEIDIGSLPLPTGGAVADAIADSVASMGENVVPRRAARLAPADGAGVVGSYVHAGGKIGVLVEAKTAAQGEARDAVQAVLRDVAMQVAAANPRYVRREEVPADEIEKEREIYRGQAATTGKPAPVIEKIVAGKVEKFFAEVCLLEQEYIRDSELTVSKLVDAAARKAGVPIEISRFVRLQLGEASGDA